MRPFYHEGQVEVEGETLHLVYDFRAIDVIESLTEQDMPDVIFQLATRQSYALSGKVLWAMLREKHEGVTLAEAAGAAFGPDAPKIGLVIGDILSRAHNLGKEEKAENPRKPRGRSKASSSSGLQPA
jgi:hypothetical protein